MSSIPALGMSILVLLFQSGGSPKTNSAQANVVDLILRAYISGEKDVEILGLSGVLSLDNQTVDCDLKRANPAYESLEFHCSVRSLKQGDLVVLKVEGSNYRPAFLNIPIFSHVAGRTFTVDCGSIILTRKRIPEVERILIGSLPNGDTLVRTTIRNDAGKDVFFKTVAITFEKHPRGLHCACFIYIPSPRYEVERQLDVVSDGIGGLGLRGKAQTQLPSKESLAVLASGSYYDDECSCTSRLKLEFSVDLISAKDSVLALEVRMPNKFDLYIAPEPASVSRRGGKYSTTQSVSVADATSWWIDLITTEGDKVSGKAVRV